jgi:hypothetical protein
MNVIYTETCKGMAMARKRFIDLSVSIEPGLPSDPPMMIPFFPIQLSTESTKLPKFTTKEYENV